MSCITNKISFFFSFKQNSVISATIMGCLFCGLMLVIAMMCGLRLYTMHSENSGYRFHLPAHIATRLRYYTIYINNVNSLIIIFLFC